MVSNKHKALLLGSIAGAAAAALVSTGILVKAADANERRACGVKPCPNHATKQPLFKVWGPAKAEDSVPAEGVFALAMCDEHLATAAKGPRHIMTKFMRRSLERDLWNLRRQRPDWSTLVCEGITFADAQQRFVRPRKR